MKEKIAKICDVIFGYGLLIGLAIGFILFLGFVVSFFTGEAAATAITTLLYKTVIPKTYVFTVIVCFIGMLGMYLRGQKAIVMKKKPGKDK